MSLRIPQILLLLLLATTGAPSVPQTPSDTTTIGDDGSSQCSSESLRYYYYYYYYYWRRQDQPSNSSSACAEPNEKAVETHRVDTEQATVTKAALFRLFADVTSGVPDWTDYCAALPLLPSRASQKRDYEILKSLRENQARYVHLLTTIKESYFDAATECDLAAAKHVLRRESQKLSQHTAHSSHLIHGRSTRTHGSEYGAAD